MVSILMGLVSTSIGCGEAWRRPMKRFTRPCTLIFFIYLEQISLPRLKHLANTNYKRLLHLPFLQE